MKSVIKLLSAVLILSTIFGALAFKAMYVSQVYVPSFPGLSGVCTVPLLGYTFYDNGETPVTRVASSLPVTTGCRTVSIYPDTLGSP